MGKHKKTFDSAVRADERGEEMGIVKSGEAWVRNTGKGGTNGTNGTRDNVPRIGDGSNRFYLISFSGLLAA